IFFDSDVDEVVEDESIAGVIGADAQAQIDVVTLTGTAEEGDEYTISSSLFDDGDVVYEVQEGDTLEDVRDELFALVIADDDHGDTFTATTTGATSITFTAEEAGTPFTLTVSEVVGLAQAQIVEFAPQDVAAQYNFNIVINSDTYSFTSTN